MNIQQLLQQIIQLLPQFQASAGIFQRALPALAQSAAVFAQAVQAFVAAQGGWQAILQAAAQSRIVQVVSGVAQTVAQSRFGQAVGAAAQAVGGTIIGNTTVGILAADLARMVGQFARAAVGGVVGAVSSGLAGIGAALASPLGHLALVTAGVAAAFVGLGVITERLGRGFLESQRHLADFSAEMAAVFAVSDVRRLGRNIETGGETAESAGSLARHLDDLADTLRPIMSLLTNLANAVLGILTSVVNVLLKPLGLIADLINKTLLWLAKRFGDSAEEGNTILVGEWLENVAKATKEAKERDDPNFRRPDLRERAQLKP